MAATDNVLIRLDVEKDRPIEITPNKDFESQAMRWSYVVRNRSRWTADKDPGEGESSPLYPYLKKDLKRIAKARVVEVALPSYPSEQKGWAHRVFPWEYAISAATRGLRSEPLTVIRHLVVNRAGDSAAVSLQRPATIESSPGGLANFYDTRVEGDLMMSALGLDAAAPRACLRDPTREATPPWVAKERPTLLHIAGVDSHQAVSLLRMEREHPTRSRLDGLAFKNAADAKAIDLVDAEALAAMVCGGEPPPDLVVCNVYNSAARMAARCVAQGARFAIGYHDVIDDNLAVLFCTSLYRQLAAASDIFDAFGAAVKAVRARGPMRGACIVLWTSVSLLDRKAAKQRQQPRVREVPKVADLRAAERVRVEVAVKPRVNYSLLHNRQSLFRILQVHRNNCGGTISDIQVTVDLNSGDTSFPYRTTFDLPEGKNECILTDDVVLPLTSALIRTQSESIASSVRVHVCCEGQTVTEQTHRVLLSPVDEWQDGQKDEWRWLPSFVLPRDPAVAKIIDSAQGVLSAIADDPAAGFDGYQSVDKSAESMDERYGCVDTQVRAIWYALLNAHGLSYINPPPSYGKVTQRLRMPTQILAERRGTCIDLALLLAACLEYVDIWPALFLLRGHAFAGYWRSEELHGEFLELQGLELMFGADSSESDPRTAGGSSSNNDPGWVLTVAQHPEVLQRVYQRHLIPLETTWLTSRGPFDGAAVEGKNNLRRSSEFEAMIDIRLARDRGVTPMPVLGGQR